MRHAPCVQCGDPAPIVENGDGSFYPPLCRTCQEKPPVVGVMLLLAAVVFAGIVATCYAI